MGLKKFILILVGASGSGKTTVGDLLTDKGFPKLVTTTTRQPRPGEKEGRDYYFIDKEQIDLDQLVEHTSYNGNIYGLSKKEVETALKNHRVVHVALDQNGADSLKALYPEESVIIFFEVSEDEMRKRMQKRGDQAEDIQKRIEHSYETGEFQPPAQTDLALKNIEPQQTADDIYTYVKEELI